MACRMCCIEDCRSKSGRKEDGINRRVLFRVNENNKQAWLNIIAPYMSEGRSNRKRLFVCDLHFKESEITRHFETKMLDGSIHKLPRAIPILTEGSLPSIFPGQEEEISPDMENITPSETSEISTQEENYTDLCNIEVLRGETRLVSVDSGISAKANEISPNEENYEDQYNINALKRDLDNIQHSGELLPKNWGYSNVPTGLYFYYFGDHYVGSRTMFVGENMELKVQANSVLVKVNIAETVTCVTDIIDAMTTIGKLTLCQGVNEYTACSKGFFETHIFCAIQRCNECQIKLRLERKQQETQQLINNLKRKIRLGDKKMDP